MLYVIASSYNVLLVNLIEFFYFLLKLLKNIIFFGQNLFNRFNLLLNILLYCL